MPSERSLERYHDEVCDKGELVCSTMILQNINVKEVQGFRNIYYRRKRRMWWCRGVVEKPMDQTNGYFELNSPLKLRSIRANNRREADLLDSKEHQYSIFNMY